MRKDADFQAKLAAQPIKQNYFSEAGKEWQSLPAEDKKKYEDEAAKLKYQYQIELENYKQARAKLGLGVGEEAPEDEAQRRK